MIPIDQMIPRGVYKIKCRNLSYGVWNPNDKGFIGIREKFGDRFLFTEYHYDTGVPYGTVREAEFVSMLPDHILLAERECFECGIPMFYDGQEKLPHGPSLGKANWRNEIPSQLGQPCTEKYVISYTPLFDHLDLIENSPLQRIIDRSLGITQD